MQKIFKGLTFLVAVSMFCFFAGSSFAEQKAAGEDSANATADKASAAGDKKAAIVNGEVITHDELDREIQNIGQRMSQMMQEAPPPEDMKERALENIINRKLLYEASQKSGISIDETQVEQNWENAVGRFPDKESFEAVLKRENVTEEELKSELRKSLAIQKYIEQEFISKIEVTDEEVKQYYESNPLLFKHPEMVKASHILIKTDESDDEAKKAEARKKIEEVEKQLKEGKDFAELAKTYSEGPTGEMGGDLGFFRKGQMVKPFEEAAFSLKEGEVSSIVQTPFGFHLIKVMEKKPEGTYPLEEVAPKIKELLSQQKAQEMVAKKLEDLRKDAKIEKFVALDDKKGESK